MKQSTFTKIMSPALNSPLLHSLLSIESESGDCSRMAEFLTTHCQGQGWKVNQDEMGNLYVTKGAAAAFPCIVAHLDTVHDISGDGIAPVYIGDNVTGINPVTMEQTGIGGDDKCGIYAALHCLANLPACKAAFFVDEEVGCLGSGAADMSFFRDCRFILQADRRGNSDFVTDISGPLSSSRFQRDVAPLLTSHGFRFSHGAMSDVMALRDNGCGIACANISAGYYNPHQPNEFINLPDLAKTCGLMLDICRTLCRVYRFTPAKRANPPKKRNFWTSTTWPDSDAWTWTPKAKPCEFCGQLLRDDESIICAECETFELSARL